MSSFPTDEHRKFAKQMEASYNEIIPDNLDQVPTSLLHIYGPSKDPLDTLYISFLHFETSFNTIKIVTCPFTNGIYSSSK
jgi:hypothetical protein